VRIDHVQVSRKHVIVSFGNGRWRFRDQRSGNGVFIDGQRVDSHSIDSGVTIQLGADGPSVVMELEPHAVAPPAPPPVAAGETRIVASYAERYFGDVPDDEPAGGRTLMIRKAFKQVQKKQQRTYAGILTTVYLYRLLLLRLQGEARLLDAPEEGAPVEPVERPERFLVRKLGKEFLVAASDIEWLQAAANYVNLHVRGQRIIQQEVARTGRPAVHSSTTRADL